MYRVIYKVFNSDGLLSSKTIDRANLADASKYIKDIAVYNSYYENWEYTPNKSVSYTINKGQYSYIYAIEEVPDRILCTAVHFSKSFTFSNGNSRSQEVPKPLGIESGTVVTGRRHGDCYAIYLALTGHKDIKDSVDGFLTVSNRFVDRIEAFQIAKLAEQLLSHVDRNGNSLCSEMLYFD